MKYIIGLGNYIKGDDSIGLRIIEQLDSLPQLPGIALSEIGNDAFRLLSYFKEETELILIVDCVVAGNEPGTWCCFEPESVVTQKEISTASTHEGDLLQVIQLAHDLSFPIPPIRIFGIEPACLDLHTGLSPTLQNKLHEYIQAILVEVGR